MEPPLDERNPRSWTRHRPGDPRSKYSTPPPSLGAVETAGDQIADHLGEIADDYGTAEKCASWWKSEWERVLAIVTRRKAGERTNEDKRKAEAFLEPWLPPPDNGRWYPGQEALDGVTCGFDVFQRMLDCESDVRVLAVSSRINLGRLSWTQTRASNLRSLTGTDLS